MRTVITFRYLAEEKARPIGRESLFGRERRRGAKKIGADPDRFVFDTFFIGFDEFHAGKSENARGQAREVQANSEYVGSALLGGFAVGPYRRGNYRKNPETEKKVVEEFAGQSADPLRPQGRLCVGTLGKVSSLVDLEGNEGEYP